MADGHEIIERNWRGIAKLDIVSKKIMFYILQRSNIVKCDNFGDDGLRQLLNKKQQQMRFSAEMFIIKMRSMKAAICKCWQFVDGNPPVVEERVVLGINCSLSSFPTHHRHASMERR